MLTAADQAAFDAFAVRARALGWIENPSRTGSWGKSLTGDFESLLESTLQRLADQGGEEGHISISAGSGVTWTPGRSCQESSEVEVTGIDQLEYLHDAVVNEVAITFTDGQPRMRITVTCDADCGYPEWSGKTVVVTLSNLLRASGVLLGHVAGPDSVNAFSEDASADTQRSIQDLCGAGITAPKRLLRLVLQSGSVLEIACDAITVQLDGR